MASLQLWFGATDGIGEHSMKLSTDIHDTNTTAKRSTPIGLDSNVPKLYKANAVKSILNWNGYWLWSIISPIYTFGERQRE